MKVIKELENLTIQEIYKKIADIEVQGATNVAIATTYGLQKYLKLEENKKLKGDELLKEVKDKGYYLAKARENEPLAKNGVKFITNKLKENPTITKAIDLCEQYLSLIAESKKEFVKKAGQVFTNNPKGIFTHCHSSSAVSVISNYAQKQKDVKVVCTETRPLYQGRITAKELLKEGIDTTMVVDSTAELFILDRSTFSIDILFIGADQITKEGAAINKIGSLGIALAAKEDNDPIYVVTPLLKVDINSSMYNVDVELRDPTEIWENAPKGLKIINPAFEIIPPKLITGYITECGVLKPEDIKPTILDRYPWINLK